MNPNKRFILAIGCSKMGGAQKVFASITKQLAFEGYKVTVVLPDGPLLDLINIENVEIILIKYKSFQGIKTISKILKRKDLYLVNTHLTNCSLLFSLINLFHRRLLCCSLHNSIIHENLNIIQKFTYPFFYFLIFKFSNGIIVNSEDNKRHFSKVACIPNSHLKVIYNGIDLPKLCHNKFQLKSINKKFQIGYVGRLSLEKGVFYLINALSQLSDIDFECKIIGDGKLRNVLHAEVLKYDLKEKVKFVGFERDVTPYFQEMDLFILPSLNEVLPLTIIEAFSYNVVTIASDVGGVKELITHLETGFLFPAKDINKLKENIKYVYSNRNKIEHIRNNAYKKFSNNFTSEIMVKNIIEHFNFIHSQKRK